MSGLGVLLWPIAYLVAIRLELAPRFPATHALVGDWYNHAMYFGVFLLGFSLAGARAAWGALERARWLTLGLAVLGWAFFAAYFGGVQRRCRRSAHGTALIPARVFMAPSNGSRSQPRWDSRIVT